MRTWFSAVIIWLGCLFAIWKTLDYLHPSFTDLLWTQLSFRWVDLWFVVVAPASVYLTKLLDRILHIKQHEKEKVKNRLLDKLFLTSVAVPEELFVRFAVQQCYWPVAAWAYNWPHPLGTSWAAAILLGIAFGLGHFRFSKGGIKTVAKTAAKGIFYGLVVALTGSLWAVILGHLANNGWLAYTQK